MAMDGCTMGNIPFYPYLPMSITNFGGDIQVCTIEPWNSAPIGMTLNARGLEAVNGDSIPLVNNWGYLNPIPGDSIFNNPNNNLRVQIPAENPFMANMQNQIQQMAAGFVMSDIGTIQRCINSSQQRLTSMLTNTEYSSDQIAQIEDLLDQLDAKEQELTEFIENELGGLDLAEQRTRVSTFEQEIREIIKQIVNIGAPAGSS